MDRENDRDEILGVKEDTKEDVKEKGDTDNGKN